MVNKGKWCHTNISSPLLPSRRTFLCHFGFVLSIWKGLEWGMSTSGVSATAALGRSMDNVRGVHLAQMPPTPPSTLKWPGILDSWTRGGNPADSVTHCAVLEKDAFNGRRLRPPLLFTTGFNMDKFKFATRSVKPVGRSVWAETESHSGHWVGLRKTRFCT